MSRYRNWHQVSILALVGLLFPTSQALAQRPSDPTEIGRVPPSSQFPPDAWGGGERAPVKPKALRGPKAFCPWCGTPHRQDTLETSDGLDTQPAEAIEPKALANYLKELLTRNVEEDRPATKHRLKTQEKLRPGEPAQVILELKERLGDGALDGTEFADSPDRLVKLIRALEAEREQDEVEEESERNSCETAQSIPVGIAVEPRSRIDALRGASAKLDEAANNLEEQDLFERADEMRALADTLRRDARSAVAEEAPRCKTSDQALKPAELRRMEPQPFDVEIELSDDIEQLREELRRVRQALESRSNQSR